MPAENKIKYSTQQIMNAVFDPITGTLGTTGGGGGTVDPGKMTRVAVNTASLTPNASDVLLGVTYTPTGAVAITLPTSQVSNIGKYYTIKDEGGNAGTNYITISGEGGETLDGSPSFSIMNDYGAITVYANGANWNIL